MNPIRIAGGSAFMLTDKENIIKMEDAGKAREIFSFRF